MTDLRPDFAEALLDRLARIAGCSGPGPGVTRLPFTAEHREAVAFISEWMHAAGLTVRLDAAGTLIGRRGPEDAPALLFGSHQDSIRQGGRFDGILGVALPLLALEALKDEDLPVAVEVLAFADEEGVRFPTALLGPRAMAGTLDAADLALCDRDGVALGEALAGFGGDPKGLAAARRDPASVLGYVEAHIEQGPVLEAEDRPLGVVTGICGIERWAMETRGVSAHAGTTPMELRRDALAGAAGIVLAVEAVARDAPELVATVGELTVSPGVVNAVPASVSFTVEVRALEDAARSAAASEIAARAERICDVRGLGLGARRTYAQPAVACDPALSDRLFAAAEATGGAPRRMMSGATHDASAMADLCPVAMLFLRCPGGVSHHPDEGVDPAALTAAGEAVLRLIRDWA